MKKISLISTVVLVFALILGVGINGAQASSILFPYLSTQSGVYSFVTIANYGNPTWGLSSVTGLHYYYGYKTADPIDNSAGCNHSDMLKLTTPNDMLTFEVNAKVVDAGNNVLFENNAPDTSEALTLSATGQIAFLIVEPRPVGPEPEDMANLFGWADVIDTTANMTLNYSTAFLNASDDEDADFASVLDPTTGWKVASWYPTTYVTTSWHILPLGLRSEMTPISGGGIMRGVYATADDANEYSAIGRDEDRYSGSLEAGVRCIGIIDRDDVLMPEAVTATNNGGFTFLEDTCIDTDGDGSCESNEPDSGSMLVHRIQTALGATGLAPRTGINREPLTWPNLDVTP